MRTHLSGFPRLFIFIVLLTILPLCWPQSVNAGRYHSQALQQSGLFPYYGFAVKLDVDSLRSRYRTTLILYEAGIDYNGSVTVLQVVEQDITDRCVEEGYIGVVNGFLDFNGASYLDCLVDFQQQIDEVFGGEVPPQIGLLDSWIAVEGLQDTEMSFPIAYLTDLSGHAYAAFAMTENEGTPTPSIDLKGTSIGYVLEQSQNPQSHLFLGYVSNIFRALSDKTGWQHTSFLNTPAFLSAAAQIQKNDIFFWYDEIWGSTTNSAPIFTMYSKQIHVTFGFNPIKGEYLQGQFASAIVDPGIKCNC